MTYIIAEPCVGLKDSACVDVCPVDCIYTRDEDDMYYIARTNASTAPPANRCAR